MPDNETPVADAAEQQQDVSDAAAASGAGDAEVALEAPEADAVEQQTPVGDAEATTDPSVSDRWDADEGDLAESSREVGYDDEEHR
jgi:hypothetical protein